MNSSDGASGSTHNRITGGYFAGPVTQAGRVEVHQAPPPVPALCALPARSRAFTGRQAEVDELLAVLGAPLGGGVETVAVSGPPGIGKTELAVQVAGRALEHGWFPGGVLFIDLQGYDHDRRVTVEQALEVFLLALGVPSERMPPGADARVRLYRSVLAAHGRNGQRTLVVIDNAATAADVTALLPTDGVNAAVVTSRQRFSGLDARLMDLQALPVESAVDLLERFLTLVCGAQDVRIRTDPDHAGRIAELCDRIPLALRLVGALLADSPDRPLAELAAQLADSRRRLDELEHDGVSVRAAFDLSYRSLDGPEARLFRLLSLHTGPEIGVDAAAALADLDSRATTRVLAALGRSHLIEAGSTYGRWRVHDLLALYSSELLLQDGSGRDGSEREGSEAAEAGARLAHHYLATTAEADARVRGEDPAGCRFPTRNDALAWFDQERANLVALAAALASQGVQLGFPLPLIRLLHHGRCYEDLLTVAGRALISPDLLPDSFEQAFVLTHLGVAQRAVGRVEEATATQRRSLHLFESLGDQRGEAMALINLGNCLLDQHVVEEAVASLERAAALGSTLDDTYVRAMALDSLGTAFQQARRYPEAAAAHRAAGALNRELGDASGEARTLVNLAATSLLQGRWEEAISHGEQALAHFRDTGQQYFEALCLTNLSHALVTVGQEEKAEDTATRAVEIFELLADRHREGIARTVLGESLMARERTDTALAEFSRARELLVDSWDRGSLARAIGAHGIALRAAGRDEEGSAALRDALVLLRNLGDERECLRLLPFLAESAIDSARTVEALAILDESAALARKLGLPDALALALTSLGRELIFAERPTEALASLTEGLAIQRRLDDRVGTAETLMLMAVAHEDLDQPHQAVAALEEAVAVRCSTTGPGPVVPFEAAVALVALGTLLVKHDHLGSGIGVLGDAASIFEALGETRHRADALTWLGLALAQADRLSESASTHLAAVDCYVELGDTAGMIGSLTNLGNTYLADGDYEGAGRSFALADHTRLIETEVSR
ncbi:tetratricopeptide repeat protein [Kitasatospora sp. NPDC097643]|uniref:tetratricopeptide repeat protein n=1 Tax=Kitasatospora sp. NPDC097643 TaxID=3157230 RepID=UPI00332DB9D7